jgi:hypothetical protein
MQQAVTKEYRKGPTDTTATRPRCEVGAVGALAVADIARQQWPKSSIWTIAKQVGIQQASSRESGRMVPSGALALVSSWTESGNHDC